MMVQAPADHLQMVDLAARILLHLLLAPLEDDVDVPLRRKEYEGVRLLLQQLLGDIQRGILNQAYIFPGKEALLSSLNPSFILITAKYGPIKPSSESSRPASCG